MKFKSQSQVSPEHLIEIDENINSPLRKLPDSDIPNEEPRERVERKSKFFSFDAAYPPDRDCKKK